MRDRTRKTEMAHRDSHLTVATSITDAMDTEETAEGIRKFASDIVRLEKFIASKLKTGNLARLMTFTSQE